MWSGLRNQKFNYHIRMTTESHTKVFPTEWVFIIFVSYELVMYKLECLCIFVKSKFVWKKFKWV